MAPLLGATAMLRATPCRGLPLQSCGMPNGQLFERARTARARRRSKVASRRQRQSREAREPSHQAECINYIVLRSEQTQSYPSILRPSCSYSAYPTMQEGIKAFMRSWTCRHQGRSAIDRVAASAWITHICHLAATNGKLFVAFKKPISSVHFTIDAAFDPCSLLT